jgi:hypothetical protein
MLQQLRQTGAISPKTVLSSVEKVSFLNVQKPTFWQQPSQVF